ncbi:TIGR00341 family protein [Salidesulfovibrio onnuriiensis]|uniref:TIGR00341 family protein n=1 Tax=Salidesulfovibrio onnuriiensis TaxID=2583823 RepID=UPI0011C768F3|nr:TIGR00341 family protein [Salidesulfovibrio onnuriiensis]
MALRLIEIIVPSKASEAVLERMAQEGVDDTGTWITPLRGGRLSIKLVMDMEDTEQVTDMVEKRFLLTGDYRIVIHPVEAVLPRLEENGNGGAEKKAGRASREELYSDAEDMCGASRNFIILVLLSTVVAVIGLIKNNPTITLAAMVIAPLMGPNVSLALATTLGDPALARRALLSNASGVLAAFLLSLLLGLVLNFDPAVAEIAGRTEVGMADLVLAFASGVAGVLSFTMGSGSSLVGVMVALALVPPLAASGLLAGKGLYDHALRAGLLFVANVTCLNLSGMGTFLLQGVRPMNWWEAKKAARITVRAVIIWLTILAVLVSAIVLLSRGDGNPLF